MQDGITARGRVGVEALARARAHVGPLGRRLNLHLELAPLAVGGRRLEPERVEVVKVKADVPERVGDSGGAADVEDAPARYLRQPLQLRGRELRRVEV